MQSQIARLAEESVTHVKTKMTYGAMNKFNDVVDSGGKSVICQLTQRAWFQWFQTGSMEEKILLINDVAGGRGCGNCGEQSIIAFVYLLGRAKQLEILLPLDLMCFSVVDHAFVVLNRTQNSKKADPPHTWGADAFISDPWLGKSYPASQLSTHWPKGTPPNPQVLYMFR